MKLFRDGIGAGEVGVANLEIQVQVHVSLRFTGDTALGVTDRIHQLGRNQTRTAIGVEEHPAAGQGLLDDLGRFAFGVDADGETEAVLFFSRIAFRFG